LYWGQWNEPLVLGVPEYKAVALAHAIILTIAVVRYFIKPWLRSLREGRRGNGSEGKTANSGVPN
jgi:hypothetical protein